MSHIKATKTRQVNDLRDFIAACEENDQLHRVKAEVDWKFEMAHVSKVNEEQKGPALLYENVKGYKTRPSPAPSPRRRAWRSLSSRIRRCRCASCPANGWS